MDVKYTDKKIMRSLIKFFISLLLISLCPLGFSDALFSPIPFFLNPRQPHLFLSNEIPLSPLCPQFMSVSACLSLTSFPLLQEQEGQIPVPHFFTPMFLPEEKITPQRLDKVLSMDSENWVSYDYSDYSFKRRRQSNNRREKVRPQKEKREEEKREEEKREEEKREEEKREEEKREEYEEGKKKRKIVEQKKKSLTEDSYTIHINKTQGEAIVEEVHQGVQEIEKGKINVVPTEEAQLEKSSEGEWEVDLKKEPAESIAVNIEDPQVDCINFKDSQTEAKSVCLECSKEALEKVQKKLKNKIEKQICHVNLIKNVKKNFEKTCSPLKFDNFVKNVLVCESCKSNVPPALMLAMMTVESSGQCTADNISERERSAGLFQINTNVHKNYLPCNRQQLILMKNLDLSGLKNNKKVQCIHNPVMNIHESIRILKENYSRTNNGKKPDFQCSENKDLNKDLNKDSWRKAVAAYNGGSRRIVKIKKLINQPPKGIDVSAWSRMSEWQKIRIYYFHCARLNNSRCEADKFKWSISNLAHTEAILGSADPPHWPHSYQKWESTISNLNKSNHCR